MKRLAPGGGIVADTAKSGIWAGLTNIIGRVFHFSRLLVLAALLSPRDFGLMGIAMLAVATTRKISELGIDSALIQNENENVDEYLNTVWTINIARGVAIFGLLYLTAPFIGSFFDEPRAVDIIRAVGIVPLLSGLRNPAIVYFQKDLQFHKRFAQEVGGSAVDAIVGIAFALIFGNVWALVFGIIAGELMQIAVSYAIEPYRPTPEFERSLAKNLVNYGKWITGLNILVFFANQGDDVFVGWFIGAGALGLYQLAYQLSNTPATEVSQIISNVIFPAYSKIQHDTDQLREGYFRALKLVTFISVPITVGIILVSPAFIIGFLGSKWEPAIPTIQILAVWGLLRALGSTCSPLFKAIGRPDYLTKISFGKVLIIAALIYPATARYGIEGTALVIVFNSLIFSEPLVYYLVMKSIDGSYRRLLWTFFLPGCAGLVMGLCVFLTREWITLQSPIIEFFLLVIVGVLSYTAMTVLLERHFDYGLKPLFRTIISAVS